MTGAGVPAKGLTGRRIFFRYGMRNALLPQTTALALALGGIVSQSVLVEVVFGYPGIGFLTLSAAQIKNFPMLLACTLVLGIVYFVATLTGDLLTAALNPRVRLARQT